MEENRQGKLIHSLSGHLFWDVDISKLDEDIDSKYIIKKVLLYGLYADFKKILNYYGLKKIIDTAVNSREIDKKTASFLSVISGIPTSRFACYITEQSRPKHWNF
jgi:hypothetical protein